MKKILRFAVLAIAAAVVFAACDGSGKEDPLEKPGDKPDTEETVPGGDENTGEENGDEDIPVTIDGKQWCFEWNGSLCALDLGVNAEGTAYFLVGFYGMYVSYLEGTYTITPTDATSGKICIINSNDSNSSEIIFEYSQVTDNTVTLNNTTYAITNQVATLSTEKLEVTPLN